MKYNFEIINEANEMTILFKNITPDFIADITSAEGMSKLNETKFYMNTVYGKITLLGNQFMILKNTKKNVTLLNIGENESATYN